MRKVVSVLFLVMFLIYGCNIVPKSVQYQREEENLIGNTDEISPVLEEIQVVLNNQGYDTGNKDGRMCQNTREAIKKFQESMGIKTTGYINKLTLKEIDDIKRVKDELELKHVYKIDVPSKKSTESIASTKEIQTALKNAGFDPGAIDGKIGPMTRQAVKEFQRTKGLKVDGVVGKKTWGELEKYLKK